MTRFCFVVLLLFVIWMCSSCSTWNVKQVDVPIPVEAPAVNKPDKPSLPIYTLTQNSKPAEVMKAYVESIYLLEGYSEELEVLLK